VALQAIVTDIEGTTSSIRFVHEVLFPYARRALPGFIDGHRHDPEVRPWLEQVGAEIGADPDAPEVVDALLHWIDIDRKHTALKALQGQIWASGYAGAAFQAHVYPEVPARLRAWHQAGLALYVYSSGSVPAQQLFFGHSEAGDLRPLFQGYFDTAIGPKRDAGSYRRILEAIGCQGAQVLFLSDVVAELDAAREAGLHTCLIERDGAVGDRNGHPAADDFDAVPLPP
jgi:enolase-phosphatase E1